MKKLNIVVMLMAITTVIAGCKGNSDDTKPYIISEVVEATDSKTEETEEIVEETEEIVEETSNEEISDDIFTDDELERDDYVDTKIREAIDSREYKDASYSERQTHICKLLTELELDGYIDSIYYDEENKMFTFIYSSGIPGGVYLEDFTSYTNNFNSATNGFNSATN